MTIDDLPTFSIKNVEHDRAIGIFAENRWMGERHIGYVITSGERFVSGRFIAVDLTQRTAAFIPDNVKDLDELQAGVTYRRIDGYWGERAELVLDRERVWTRRAYEAEDAVRESGHSLRKASKGAGPKNGDLVKGGWDHEHCDICWAKISPFLKSIAMFSEPDNWLCQECYAKFVVPRSLDFIVEAQ